jgi:hypothetical protein
MLSSHALDRKRTEAAWRTILKPSETTLPQVCEVVFGSVIKEVQTTDIRQSRYQLVDFSPEGDDANLIEKLQHCLLKRRHNVVLVGPPGTGKSCLIQTLTAQYGVQFFGTADELKEISPEAQFIVFDDFDFSSLTVECMKRMLDREFPTQRIKVRYTDAMLTHEMTRVILCNELHDHFDNEAVRSRVEIINVSAPLFKQSRIVKFRGTHLSNDEEFDNEGFGGKADDDEFAWAYNVSNKRATANADRDDIRIKYNANVSSRSSSSSSTFDEEELEDLRRMAEIPED